jgi:hypothetical protein
MSPSQSSKQAVVSGNLKIDQNEHCDLSARGSSIPLNKVVRNIERSDKM